MKKCLFLCVGVMALLVGCSASVKTAGGGGTPLPTSGSPVTWASADQQTFLQSCGLGTQACQCEMKIAQQQGITFQQFQSDPATSSSNIVASSQFGQCMNGQ